MDLIYSIQAVQNYNLELIFGVIALPNLCWEPCVMAPWQNFTVSIKALNFSPYTFRQSHLIFSFAPFLFLNEMVCYRNKVIIILKLLLMYLQKYYYIVAQNYSNIEIAWLYGCQVIYHKFLAQ